jgi:hypothetical protein
MFGRPLTEAPPMSHRQEMRVFVAFLVQPLVAALCGFLAFPIVEVTGRPLYGGYATDVGEAALAFGLGTGLVGLFVALLAALPLFVWLRRRGPITLKKTLISGALLGNVLTVVVVVLAVLGRPGINAQSPTYGLFGGIRAVVFGTAVGMTCAAVFWWIAGRHLRAR